MKRYQLIVAYDGTCYHGFARQKNTTETIQQKLEEAISHITNQKVEVIASGRTDAGVHAKAQCCVVDLETKLPVERMAKAFNSQLPLAIRIREVAEVKPDFHPRFMAKQKTYCYQILTAKTNDPFLSRYVYFYPHELDIKAMEKAASLIEGTHDFQCFCAAGSTVEDTVRTVYGIALKKEGELIRIEVCGNGFLYNMVRIIAGTLIEVGRGRLEPLQINKIIESRDRCLAGPTAPPEGLMLQEVYYEDRLRYE